MNFLLAEFERHHARMVERARERLEAVQLTNLVDAGRVKTSVSEDDLLGKRLPRDEFQGDTNFRTLKALLKKVDERGFERVRAARSLPSCPVSPCRARRSLRTNLVAWSQFSNARSRHPTVFRRPRASARIPRKLLQGLGACHVQGRLGRAKAGHHAEARLEFVPRRGADQHAATLRKDLQVALPCPVLVPARAPQLTQGLESAASPSSAPASSSRKRPRLWCSGKPSTHPGPSEPRHASHSWIGFMCLQSGAPRLPQAPRARH